MKFYCIWCFLRYFSWFSISITNHTNKKRKVERKRNIAVFSYWPPDLGLPARLVVYSLGKTNDVLSVAGIISKRPALGIVFHSNRNVTLFDLWIQKNQIVEQKTMSNATLNFLHRPKSNISLQYHVELNEHFHHVEWFYPKEQLDWDSEKYESNTHFLARNLYIRWRNIFSN